MQIPSADGVVCKLMPQRAQFTVVQMEPETGEAIKTLYTGLRSECLAVIQAFMDDRGWNHKQIAIIDPRLQRHVTWWRK
jgi:hypothetical protein